MPVVEEKTRLVMTPECNEDPFRQLKNGAVQHRPSKLCLRAMNVDKEFDVYSHTDSGTPVALSKECEVPQVIFDLTGVGGLKHRMTGKCLQVSPENTLVLKEGCEKESAIFDFVQMVASSKGQKFNILPQLMCMQMPRKGLIVKLYTSESSKTGFSSPTFDAVADAFTKGATSAKQTKLSPLSAFVQSLSDGGVPVTSTRLWSAAMVEKSSLLSTVEGKGTVMRKVTAQSAWVNSFKSLPEIGSRSANKVAILDAASIDLPLVSGYKHNFVATLTGSVLIDTDGDWTFYIESIDGSKLSIDGAVVVDNDGVHPMESVSGTVYLKQGWHHFELSYFKAPAATPAVRGAAASSRRLLGSNMRTTQDSDIVLEETQESSIHMGIAEETDLVEEPGYLLDPDNIVPEDVDGSDAPKTTFNEVSRPKLGLSRNDMPYRTRSDAKESDLVGLGTKARVAPAQRTLRVQFQGPGTLKTPIPNSNLRTIDPAVFKNLNDVAHQGDCAAACNKEDRCVKFLYSAKLLMCKLLKRSKAESDSCHKSAQWVTGEKHTTPHSVSTTGPLFQSKCHTQKMVFDNSRSYRVLPWDTLVSGDWVSVSLSADLPGGPSTGTQVFMRYADAQRCTMDGKIAVGKVAKLKPTVPCLGVWQSLTATDTIYKSLPSTSGSGSKLSTGGAAELVLEEATSDVAEGFLMRRRKKGGLFRRRK